MSVQHKQYREEVNVWAAINGDHLIRPFFIVVLKLMLNLHSGSVNPQVP